MNAFRTDEGRFALVFMLCWVGAICSLGCSTEKSSPPSEESSFEDDLARIDRGTLPTLSVVTFAEGLVTNNVTLGEVPEEPIYLIASVSKTIVGLALVHALQEGPLSLDRDVNEWLDWPEPLRHPDYPHDPITLRQLAQHESGLGANADFYYDTYPKPDPDVELDVFLQDWAGPDGEWLDAAPGELYAYSNLGAALVGLVIEKASGSPFDEYCVTHLFEPMLMTDTSWTWAGFDDAQKARVQVPHDALGDSLEHYGFNDYPSGLLRTTTNDMAILFASITQGLDFLDPESIALFEDEELLIEARELAGEPGFAHDGGEAGVVSSLAYRRSDGFGWFYVANGEFETEGELEEFQGRLEARLLEEAPDADSR